jgi:hypothetical protein
MRAEQARELSDTYHEEYDYKLIQMRIAKEASSGNYEVVHLNIPEQTKAMLRADGYKILDNGIGIAGPSYKISW